MASRPSDSAILNLGDIGEENTFTSSVPLSTGKESTVHTFDDKIPDSALDEDEDIGGGKLYKNLKFLFAHKRFENNSGKLIYICTVLIK